MLQVQEQMLQELLFFFVNPFILSFYPLSLLLSQLLRC